MHLIDPRGTEFRDGKLLLPEGLRSRRTPQWWEPQGDKTHYKIVARGIGGRILWQGNFDNLVKALTFWQALHELGPAPHQWDLPTPSWHPGLYIPGIAYEFSTVVSFTSTGTTSWTAPTAITATDYLGVAAGGGGGSNLGGGGGAGGLLQASAYSVIPGNNYTVTVGVGGTGLANFTAGRGTNGGNSVFDTNTAVGGGGGGGDQPGVTGAVGGSGGGGSDNGLTNGVAGAGGAGTAGQGNSGGAGFGSGSGGISSGGGGGGARGAGANATSATSGGGGIGGIGLQLTISGTPTYYAGGGSGNNQASAALGGGGTDSVNGAANTGGGGGSRANGGSGVVILAFGIFIPYNPWPQLGPLLAQ